MKLYIQIVLLSLGTFPAFAQSNFINFADSNFEKTLRRNVERDWIYLPSYTGPEYQFTQADLANVYWLDLDESDLSITSLADLQWFTNLQGLFLWDASEVSDFSPVWALSDQLQYLAINGSRGADLSGVSNMDTLISLDLYDNQLTDLSILGNYPDLMNLSLDGNYLDLSDSEVMTKIDSILSQIVNRQNSQEYWYYGSGVEYEPQYPAGFRNLSSETSRVDALLAASPNNAEANLLRGLYSLLNLMESTEATGLKEFAVSVGVDPTIRNFVLSDLPTLGGYDVELNAAFQFGKLAELMESSIITSLKSADLSFSKVPESSVIELTQEITGTENLVYVDKADVLVLRSITNILAGLAALQSGYDWEMNAGHMQGLDDTDSLTAEQIRAHNPIFGGIRSTAQLAKAKVFLQTAIHLYIEASSLLTDDKRLGVENRLFVLSLDDLEEEAEFRSALLDFESAMSGPYALEEDSDELIDLSRLFSGNVNLSNLLPENKENKFTTDQVSDPTMGGLLPKWTQRRVSEEIDQAELLWDLSGGEWPTHYNIKEPNFSNYPDGYAPVSIDGFNVTFFEDGETLTFSNGYRYTNEEETTKYIYEKTGANEGKITYPFEDEGGAVEISQITFLSPNHGTFSWTEYSDSTTNTVLDTSSGNWSILPGSVRSNLQEGYYTGGNPTQVSGGEYVLSGSVSSGSSGVKKMPPELLPIIADDPAGNSFLFIDEAEDVVGIEGKVMLPSTNAIGSGIYISLWDATPLNSLGIELVKTEVDNASLRFESGENGDRQDISIPAELDKNYTLRVTHRLGKSAFYIDGEKVGEFRTATTPDYWGFGAFNANGSSDYNGTVSDIKILNKYPVADYSSPILQDASGLSIIEKSNSNDYHWGLDLNGTTMWAYSPDLGHKRFKYEFKEDTVVRSTINQWDDNQTDEEVTLPYSLSADGFLFIQGADHGDEYLNVVGVDGVVISTKYGATKSIAQHEDFSDFSHTVATEDGKLRTLEISDNGEDPDSFSITDDLGNSLVGFNAIEDLIEYLEEQDENATFPKSIELINQPIISLLQMYIADNNKTDFFYTDLGAATDHFSGMAFESAELGPLSFHVFKGYSIEKNLPYGKNGKSDYLITTPLSFEGINTSTHLTTEYTDDGILTDLDDLALMVAQQFVEKGSSPSDIIIEPVINDYSLDVTSIHRIYNDPLSGVPLIEYSILIYLNHTKDSTYWLSAELTGVDEPIEHSSFESALSIARSFRFDSAWEETGPSLDDFGSGSGTTNTFDNVPTFEHSVSVPFKVTEYSGTQNWYNSSWFGDFFQSSNGWIFHPDLGWLYPVVSNDQESCWMYAEDFGWIWVDSYYFPLFYSDVRSNWIYYYYYAPGPVFWDYEENGWSNPGTSPIAADEIEASNTENYQNWELEMFNNLW